MGGEFLSLHQLLSHVQFSSHNAPSTQAPFGYRETPSGFLQTPVPPSKPCSDIPLPWGLSLTSRSVHQV